MEVDEQEVLDYTLSLIMAGAVDPDNVITMAQIGKARLVTHDHSSVTLGGVITMPDLDTTGDQHLTGPEDPTRMDLDKLDSFVANELGAASVQAPTDRHHDSLDSRMADGVDDTIMEDVELAGPAATATTAKSPTSGVTSESVESHPGAVSAGAGDVTSELVESQLGQLGDSTAAAAAGTHPSLMFNSPMAPGLAESSASVSVTNPAVTKTPPVPPKPSKRRSRQTEDSGSEFQHSESESSDDSDDGSNFELEKDDLEAHVSEPDPSDDEEDELLQATPRKEAPKPKKLGISQVYWDSGVDLRAIFAAKDGKVASESNLPEEPLDLDTILLADLNAEECVPLSDRNKDEVPKSPCTFEVESSIKLDLSSNSMPMTDREWAEIL